MSHVPLADFFAEMSRLLDGARTADQVLAAIGPSPSGSARFSLYPALVARQRRDVLEALFPQVKRACQHVADGLWLELREAYSRAHPPRHWEPNQHGERFVSFLVERRERERWLPSCLEELADFAWIRYVCGVAAPPADELDALDDGVRLDRTLFLRTYDHDVIGYGEELHPAGTPPAPTPTTVLVYWSRTRQAVFVARPSTAALVVIGRRLGRDPTAGGARPVPGASEDELRRADDMLVAWGAIGPAPPG